jgi:cyclopropane fatty-acyl-phospholipid synthase-like methyltransferase
MELLAIIIVIILTPLVYSGLSLAPWVPCRRKDLIRINQLAGLKPGQTFFELGCGDGRVSSFVAQNNPHSKVIGFELALTMYLWAKWKAIFRNTQNLKIKFKDIFKTDLSMANVIYVYGMPKPLANRLFQKLSSELKPGTKIISYVFRIKGFIPQIIDKPHPRDCSIYVYEIN